MYIPKNKIKTNLYTKGNEFGYLKGGGEYNGYYHKLYTGKFYTGKTPNDKPVEEIYKFPKDEDKWDVTSINGTQPYVFYTNNTIPSSTLTPTQIYSLVKDVNTSKIFKIPRSYYPKPTEDDYNLGVFTRYFCVKVNEDIYLEISKDTYDALNNQKGDWMWQLFTPFQLLWTISGEEKEVEKTNYNMTIIQEKRLKRRGLTQFLRNNYLKFYPSPYNTPDLISPTTNVSIKKDKPSIKDLFTITKPKLAITLKEIENAKTATPAVTSSIGNPLTGIRVDTSFEDSKSDQRRTN
jgi:hypothetical protein